MSSIVEPISIELRPIRPKEDQTSEVDQLILDLFQGTIVEQTKEEQDYGALMAAGDQPERVRLDREGRLYTLEPSGEGCWDGLIALAQNWPIQQYRGDIADSQILATMITQALRRGKANRLCMKILGAKDLEKREQPSLLTQLSQLLGKLLPRKEQPYEPVQPETFEDRMQSVIDDVDEILDVINGSLERIATLFHLLPHQQKSIRQVLIQLKNFAKELQGKNEKPFENRDELLALYREFIRPKPEPVAIVRANPVNLPAPELSLDEKNYQTLSQFAHDRKNLSKQLRCDEKGILTISDKGMLSLFSNPDAIEKSRIAEAIERALREGVMKRIERGLKAAFEKPRNFEDDKALRDETLLGSKKREIQCSLTKGLTALCAVWSEEVRKGDLNALKQMAGEGSTCVRLAQIIAPDVAKAFISSIRRWEEQPESAHRDTYRIFLTTLLEGIQTFGTVSPDQDLDALKALANEISKQTGQLLQPIRQSIDDTKRIQMLEKCDQSFRNALKIHCDLLVQMEKKEALLSLARILAPSAVGKPFADLSQSIKEEASLASVKDFTALKERIDHPDIDTYASLLSNLGIEGGIPLRGAPYRPEILLNVDHDLIELSGADPNRIEALLQYLLEGEAFGLDKEGNERIRSLLSRVFVLKEMRQVLTNAKDRVQPPEVIRNYFPE